jgi:hypothetical protein
MFTHSLKTLVRFDKLVAKVTWLRQCEVECAKTLAAVLSTKVLPRGGAIINDRGG